MRSLPQDASGETLIKFIAPPIASDTESSLRALDAPTEQHPRVWSHEPPPSAYSDADYADEFGEFDGADDSARESERNDLDATATVIDTASAGAVVEKEKKASHPSPERHEDDDDDTADGALCSPAMSVMHHHQQHRHHHQPQQPKPRARTAAATLHVSNAVFFRDAETLREMRQTLELEKQTLAHEHAALEQQLRAKQTRSASLKRELEDLKTRVTLASVLNQTSSSSSSMSSRGMAPAPQTAADWRERVLDQKLETQQRKQELNEVRPTD